MPRTHRLHAPGAGVHITARLQSGAKLFDEDLRDTVAEYLCEAATLHGTDLLALVIMPNHFHLVIKQGLRPLGWMMQRSMQRMALLVRKKYGGEGHIFGRRYWSCVCPTPDYLRVAIVYTHLNPWKAGLCLDPADYRWSSHKWMFEQPQSHHWASQLAQEKSRFLFARDSFDSADIKSNYNSFVEYAKLRYLISVPGDRYVFDWPDDPCRPYAPMGDQHWATDYSQAPPSRYVLVEKREIRDRAVAVLRLIDRDCTIDMLRHGGKARRIVHIRRELVAVLRSSGYRPSAIARVLCISPSTVSDVARRIAANYPAS